MWKYFGIFLFLFAVSTLVFAQTPQKRGAVASVSPYEDIVRKREFTIGLMMHTHGFGFSANFVKINNIFKKTVYEIQLMNLRHPKEVRQSSRYASGIRTARSFVYGKQNNFYNLNASIGQVRSLAEKARKSGVSISLYYTAGVSLGIAKPYYLDLIYDISGDIRSQSYTPENESLFLNDELIYGASSFAKGLSELKIHPGLQAKFALSFDWAAHQEFVKAVEVGAMVNGYFRRIPIMVSEENKFLFVNFYLRLLLGKRW